MTPGQLYEVNVNLALTIQGKDWQYAPNADTVRSKDYELPDSQNSGLFFAEHPNRDPALFNGTSTLATGAGQCRLPIAANDSLSNGVRVMHSVEQERKNEERASATKNSHRLRQGTNIGFYMRVYRLKAGVSTN